VKVLVISGKAPSLRNVARDIAYVLMLEGHQPRLLSYIVAHEDLRGICDAIIYVYPASPLFCAQYMLHFRDTRVLWRMPAAFYTTIEGRPSRKFIRHWMLRDCEFIANSRYTADKLAIAGFKVVDIIPHGLVPEMVAEARKLIPTTKRLLKHKHGNKVIIGAVAFWHARKGLDRLAEAVKFLYQKRKDFVVHLVSNKQTKRILGDVPGLFIDTIFGDRQREEIVAFMGACDWLVVPSLAEGFCLPIIEANSVGTPVIHCMYPPLNEVTDPEANLTFEYIDVKYVDINEGIDFELHLYDPRTLAKMMDYAIDMVKNNPQEYEKRRKLATRALERFNALELYRRLLRYLR